MKKRMSHIFQRQLVRFAVRPNGLALRESTSAFIPFIANDVSTTQKEAIVIASFRPIMKMAPTNNNFWVIESNVHARRYYKCGSTERVIPPHVTALIPCEPGEDLF